MINTVVLLVGGNEGERMEYLRSALQMIESELGHIQLQSSVYESESWGFESQKAFLNLALEIETTLEPEALLERIHRIEEALGRQRGKQQWSDRTMDIDILFYNDSVVNKPELIIPHKALPYRRFALLPLAEIKPRLKHPILHMEVGELLNRCEDLSEVRKLEYVAVSV